MWGGVAKLARHWVLAPASGGSSPASPVSPWKSSQQFSEDGLMRDALKIFAGNSNRPLAKEICDYLGVPLGAADVRTFSDGEIAVEITENVRGGDVFVM